MSNARLEILAINYRIKLEGMIAANAMRIHEDGIPHYSEDHFQSLASELEEDLDKLNKSFGERKAVAESNLPDLTDFSIIGPYVIVGTPVEVGPYINKWTDSRVVGIPCKIRVGFFIPTRDGNLHTDLVRIPQAEMKKDGGASWWAEWCDKEKWEANHDRNN